MPVIGDMGSRERSDMDLESRPAQVSKHINISSKTCDKVDYFQLASAPFRTLFTITVARILHVRQQFERKYIGAIPNQQYGIIRISTGHLPRPITDQGATELNYLGN